jgi:hypothetical protein
MMSRLADVPRQQSDRVQSERDHLKAKYTMIAAGGAIVFLLVLIGILVVFVPKPEGREANYGGLGLICLSVVAAAGAATYLTCGNNNQKRAQRDKAFEELCQRYSGLRPGRRTEIEGSSIGTIPWFHSEEWSHAYGLVSGEYEDSQIIAVECTQVVDPILATTDSRLMQGLAGIASGKHKRLFLRAMDATIFVEPLPNVSDLLFVPRTDPSRAYYKRDLEQQDCDLANVFKLPRELRRKYWMAAAEPEECGGLFTTELPALLASQKWCIVQVVGGHCVVLTSQWHGNYPGRAPSTLAAITENLAFAQAVYRQLRLFSKNGTDSSAPAGGQEPQPTSATTSTLESSAEPVAAAQVVAAPTPDKPRRRPHSMLAKLGLLGIGIPLLLIGLLSTLAFYLDWQRGLAAGSWPQADARVIDSGVDAQIRHRKGQEVRRFKPRVSYEYEVNGQRFTGDRVKYGVASATMSEDEADQVLARYPKGAAAKVHYLAERPHISVLQPGLQEESKLIAYMWVTGAFTLMGTIMSVYALIGKRARRAHFTVSSIGGRKNSEAITDRFTQGVAS